MAAIERLTPVAVRFGAAFAARRSLDMALHKLLARCQATLAQRRVRPGKPLQRAARAVLEAADLVLALPGLEELVVDKLEDLAELLRRSPTAGMVRCWRDAICGALLAASCGGIGDGGPKIWPESYAWSEAARRDPDGTYKFRRWGDVWDALPMFRGFPILTARGAILPRPWPAPIIAWARGVFPDAIWRQRNRRRQPKP